MQIAATHHYQLVESVVSKTSELMSYFDRIKAIADSLDCDVYWRGQADHTWGIRSSLVRRLSPDALTDGELARVEGEVLKEVQRWMSSTSPKLLSNLEWLAYLQHNWIPTRLLDFTPDPLVATFFACESQDAIDGRLFAVLIKRSSDAVDGSNEYDINDTKSGSVVVFSPRIEVSPRLAAQAGVFILGKLPSTQVNRAVQDDLLNTTRQLLKDEVVSIMSLPFYFRSMDETPRAESTAVASYTARIHINKPSVRRELRKEGAGNRNLKPAKPIDHAYCYPDVDGMRRYSRMWQRILPSSTSADGALI